MAKSAIDRLKEMSNKKLVLMLGCPQEYGLRGTYTIPDGGCAANHPDVPVDEKKCYICWTKKI